MWNVDAFPEYVIECLCASESISISEKGVLRGEWGVDDAWKAANQDPIRDRLGPLILLQLIETTWDSWEPVLKLKRSEKTPVSQLLKTCLEWDMSYKGWVSAG